MTVPAIDSGLARLLEPRSIAVVGATDRPDSYGDTILRNLERLGFDGPLYGVNPGRTSIRGVPCVPSLDDLPSPVDAVAVAVPAAGVPAVIADAARLGCGGAVVVSAGFGEVESGKGLERELVAAAGDMPVCGPNGNGIVSFATGAAIWGDSVQALEAGPRGDDLPERQRRRQRARLPARDRLPHRDLDRQRRRLRHLRLAARAERARRGRLDRALPRVRRRRGRSSPRDWPVAPSAGSASSC